MLREPNRRKIRRLHFTAYPLKSSRTTVEEFTCELTLFQEPPFPTTSFPTTPRNARSFPICRAHIPWFSSSAAAASAAKDRRQAEGLVQLHLELEVAYCRLVTISTDNITAMYLSPVVWFIRCTTATGSCASRRRKISVRSYVPLQISGMRTIRFSEAEFGSLSKREALVRSPT